DWSSDVCSSDLGRSAGDLRRSEDRLRPRAVHGLSPRGASRLIVRRLIVRGRSPNSVNPIARPVVPSCWRAWLHLASLVEERGDLPGYPLVFLELAVVVDEVHE